jgi:hypothetical protein
MEEWLMKPRELAERLGASMVLGVSPHRLALEEEQYPMNDTGSNDLALGRDGVTEAQCLPGIIAVLGELKPGTIVTEEGLAQLFKRHVVSVKRAVERGELPPPCRLFGARVWTAGVLIRYIEHRLDNAAQEAERDGQRMQKLSPVPHSSRRP